MATATASVHIPSSPDVVWAHVGDPARIADVAPFIESSRVEGDTRTSVLINGATVRERIVDHDDAQRRYVYSVVEAPFPVEFHRGEARVEVEGAGARLTWSAEVKPDELAAKMQPNLDALVAAAAAALTGEAVA